MSCAPTSYAAACKKGLNIMTQDCTEQELLRIALGGAVEGYGRLFLTCHQAGMNMLSFRQADEPPPTVVAACAAHYGLAAKLALLELQRVEQLTGMAPAGWDLRSMKVDTALDGLVAARFMGHTFDPAAFLNRWSFSEDAVLRHMRVCSVCGPLMAMSEHVCPHDGSLHPEAYRDVNASGVTPFCFLHVSKMTATARKQVGELWEASRGVDRHGQDGSLISYGIAGQPPLLLPSSGAPVPGSLYMGYYNMTVTPGPLPYRLADNPSGYSSVAAAQTSHQGQPAAPSSPQQQVPACIVNKPSPPPSPEQPLVKPPQLPPSPQQQQQPMAPLIAMPPPPPPPRQPVPPPPQQQQQSGLSPQPPPPPPRSTPVNPNFSQQQQALQQLFLNWLASGGQVPPGPVTQPVSGTFRSVAPSEPVSTLTPALQQGGGQLEPDATISRQQQQQQEERLRQRRQLQLLQQLQQQQLQLEEMQSQQQELQRQLREFAMS